MAAAVDPEAPTPEVINARLRALGRLKPTAQLRAEVTAMLDHKWEGVQTVAAGVLGEWGGPESVEVLRAWLISHRGRPAASAARGVAARAPARCVTEADVPWVLDLYFASSHPDLKHELFPVLAALPAEPTIARLEAAAGDPDPGRREGAARALRRIHAEARTRPD